jgi:hypothetical protein
VAHTRAQVIAAAESAFPTCDAATVLAVLDLYGTEVYERERERVQLAIIALSEGSEAKLLHFVQTAKKDYRDILYWAASGPLSESEGERQRQAAARLLDQWGKK